jgi:hypothetical protein
MLAVVETALAVQSFVLRAIFTRVPSVEFAITTKGKIVPPASVFVQQDIVNGIALIGLLFIRKY